jgi:hypothetical protein
MNFKAKRENLQRLYELFDTSAYAYKKHAICKIGCTYCCTDAGKIDILTIEGLVIRERLNSMHKPVRKALKKKITQDKHTRENKKIASCPFLKKDNTCLIYDIRPFSCRQLYSIQECRGRGPTIHRQVSELAKDTVRKMQRLDHTGYSGHISFILDLLNQTDFRRLYLSGGFDPSKIIVFGKAHEIIINAIVSRSDERV